MSDDHKDEFLLHNRKMFRWRSVTVFCCCHLLLVQGILPPDGTGLVGSTPTLDTHKPLVPLKFWANPRRSPKKPRRKDLHEPTLLRLMASDFDSRWMRRAQHHTTQQLFTDEEERQTVNALRDLLSENDLPAELPQEYRTLVKSWLVRTATCPIKYVWDDLGSYFWPRWVKRVECDNQKNDVKSGINIGGDRRNDTGDSGVTYKPLENHPSCSWPPGMMCVPGVVRNLQILRWHCRLRKNNGNSNNVWSADRLRKAQERRKKRRKRYRCLWLKVPFPVSEDCVCACSPNPTR